MTTAREITAHLRLLFPQVRLSTAADTGPGSEGLFRVKLPTASASHIGGSHGLETFLGRRLATTTAPEPVKVISRREVRRRDCGRDVEFFIRVGREGR